MANWSVAVGLVAASDKNYLDGAEAWFPKGEEVIAQRETVSIAHGDLAAAEKELARLENKPGVSLTGTIVAARRRWQAEDLKKSAKLEKDEAEARLVLAQAKAKAERERALCEEGSLERATLKDPSRNEAWNALFAIFAVINFVGPYAIGQVIEKWRREHGAAKSAAQDGHYEREGARILRETRAAQKAHAMQLFGLAVENLLQKGVSAELLNGVDGAEIAGAAAERFDRR